MNTTCRSRTIGAFFLAALLLPAALMAGQINIGDTFPDLAGFGLTGKLPPLDGKVVMVDFWASWCAPCKASFPVLDELQKTYAGKGFVLVGVSVDEDAVAMERFLGDHVVSFPTVRDAEQKLVAAASIQAMPTSFLLDRDGTVRFIHNGFRGKQTEEELVKQIEELLQ